MKVKNTSLFLTSKFNCIQYAADCQYFGTENVSERGKEIIEFRKKMILEDDWAEVGIV
jgi:hypothetical protein